MQNFEHFKHKLLALKNDMEERITAIDKEIKHEGMSSDWSEQATERENDEVLESLGNASKAELEMINHALKKIDSGEYFSCSVCRKDIPTARLELLPFSTRCVSCEENNNN
jgi:RNA polymerase-binding transcription factor DksA|tara:strand:+ start:434 stop:766 length:333 start_codon:yes stop_codon:yes gene_type:complete